MKNNLMALSLLPLLAAGSSLHSVAAPSRDSAAKEPESADSAAKIEWYATLLSSQAKLGKNSNVCLSPYSLASCLALLKPGAAGQTRAQLDVVQGELAALSAQASSSSLPLQSANRLYIDLGFKPYEQYLQQIGSASLSSLPLSTQCENSRTDINKWVEQQTKSRIKDLLPKGALDSNTRLVAVNAVHMLAEWQFPFHKQSTSQQNFSCGDGKQRKVDTMYAVDRESSMFAYPQVPGSEFAVAFPYKYVQGKQRAWMLCLMPDKQHDAASLAGKFAAGSLESVRKQLAQQGAEGDFESHVSLPKFSFSTSMDLGTSLKELGVTLPFSERADFSLLSPVPLQLSLVVQKSFIAVDEEKTEAAAATAAVVATLSIPRPKQKRYLRFDRPFVFVVLDSAPGMPYFIGIVQNPLQQ